MTDEPLHLGLVGPAPPPNGGMATQTRQLIDLLRREGVRVSPLVTNSPYWPRWVEHIRGVRAIFRLVPYCVSAWKLAGKVDVIHIMANSGWSWQLFTAPVAWLASMRGTPVIINYRGGEALTYFQKSFARVEPTLRRASRIVVPSGFLEEVFQRFGVESAVIPNIIDRDRFFPPSESDSSRFTLVVTRNLEPIYAIDMAIKAVALVADAIPELELKIAGSGPQLTELEMLAERLGIGDKVEFVGRLDREEICRFYQRAQVMLNPTTVDNMPNSVLEALATGVVVVSTRVGGVPYIVEHEKTALLVESGNETQMAEAILRVYQDEALRGALARAGQEEVEKYSWPNVRNQWIEVYRHLAGGGL